MLSTLDENTKFKGGPKDRDYMRKVYPNFKNSSTSLAHLSSGLTIRSRPTRNNIEIKSMNEKSKTLNISQLENKTARNYEELMIPDPILSKNTLAIDEILEEEEDSHEEAKATPYATINSYSRSSNIRNSSKKERKRRGAILCPKDQLNLGLVSRKNVTN